MSFLINCSQFFFHQCASSSTVFVKSGFIQEAVIGPLMFAIFIIEMLKGIKNGKLHLFADSGKPMSANW